MSASNDPTRRTFLQVTAATLASARVACGAEPPAAPSGRKRTIGIQVGAVSFVDEGVERVLDTVQERGAVDTIFLAVFTYGRGIAGRQIPGQPLPDHGKQEYDTRQFHGGNYATPHARFYKDTPIRPEGTKAPEFGDLDIIAEVLPAAKKRGMRVICWLEDVWRTDVPGVERLRERSLEGKPAGTLCFNNPGHRAFLEGLVEDYASSYDVDGIMWGCERQGAFANALGSSHGGGGRNPDQVTCFCEHCRANAAKVGINFDRVKEGFGELSKFVKAARKSQRPIDGYHVTLWRLILRYPELLAWENFWHEGLRETYRAIYGRVKSVKRDLPVGWHIWHNNSFSPIYRAEQDLTVLGEYSDFLKMVMYHNCGGPRIAGYIDAVGQTIYGDVPRDRLLRFHYDVLNYGDGEPAYDAVRTAGLKGDYVLRETRRAVGAVTAGKTRILPGIDIDIPTAAGESKSTPGDVKAAVRQAFEGGADGVILSRKYSEMRLANLAAAGEGVREFGRA